MEAFKKGNECSLRNTDLTQICATTKRTVNKGKGKMCPNQHMEEETEISLMEVGMDNTYL